ncbi:hypothetical protein LSH36_58g19051 [Paralvinella palmiformis]|uniref:PH domain-containing protein n=1 Tax=Paralvinella palmiformis TaxID=53620 RepID=A0AAD9K4P7_9ANNE|nr:hypothetical protein LSH36_58g19051 [Paralvinella palmiformis]
MADNESQVPRAKKFHEGWMYHQPTNGKIWSKYWMVLRGKMLFIFSTDRTGSDEMKGTLSLGPDTELVNLPPETKKKGFKFELTTSSANNERKVNRFKGIIPSDVHLLPGQVKNVQDATAEVRNRPPPLPDMTVPRPRLTEWSTAPHQFESTVHRFSDKSYRNNDDNGSDDSGSFKSHMTEERHRSESTPAAISPSGVQNLRQLMHRQRDLASHELTSVMSLSDHSEKFPFTSSYKMPDLIPQVSPSAAVFTAKPKAPIPVAKSLSDSSASVTLERHNGFSPTVHNGYNGHSNNNNQIFTLQKTDRTV